MFLMNWNKPIAWAPEDGTGVVVDEAAPAVEADAGSVLYPEEGKPAEEAAQADAAEAIGGDDASEGDKADPADTVPEDGKYDLKMPEGVEVDTALLETFAPQFKELGLTTKQAQALADKFIEAQTKQGEAKSQEWAKTVSGWVDQAKADPEIGGANWDSTAKTASGVVQRFGTPELKEYLNASGAGNHPELIRFMAKVGAMIGEDNPAISENPGNKVAKDTASILYPDDQPKGK